MRRANGSRLGGPQVPPSPSLCIVRVWTPELLAQLLHSLVRVSRRVECSRRLAKRPQRKAWTTSRPNFHRHRALQAVTRRGRRTNESVPAASGLRYGGGNATTLLGGLQTLRTVGYKFASAETVALPAQRVLIARCPPHLAGPTAESCLLYTSPSPRD